MTSPEQSPKEVTDSAVQTVATQDDLENISKKFHDELEDLREQIGLLQSRAEALEAQIAKIEPLVEARASKTEKLVHEMQIELRKVTKFLGDHDKKEAATYSEIKTMLQTLLERTE
jgi:small-conductance mechanosensitive channel